MNFAHPEDHRVELKESEERKKYLDFARGLKNMNVTVIPIVIGALGAIHKGLVKKPEDLELRGQGKKRQKELDIRGRIDSI